MSSNERSKRLLSVRDHHTTEIVDGITYEYPDEIYKVFEYDVPQRRGEGAKKKPRKVPKTKRERTDQSNTEESAQRSKTEIRNYIMVNKFDLYATFTFAQDREDVELCMAKMKAWLKNYQKNHPKCQYLCVHEFHADGKALHFHVLFRNFAGKLEPAINPNSGEPLKIRGKQVYNLPQFKHGFTNAVKIDGSKLDRMKLAGYLSKYLTKDIPEFFNKKRYWRSRNLAHPNKVNSLPEWYRRVEPIWTKEVRFGRLSWFMLGKSANKKAKN